MAGHRLICGDVRNQEIVQALMGKNLACMTFNDPPYDVAIAGHVSVANTAKAFKASIALALEALP